jgi:small subunit ribosomal protein S6
MFILDSGRYSRDNAGVVGEVEQIIRSHGGEIEISRLYEDRRLAYPIKGHRKGTYWLTYFRIDGPQIPLVTRQCEINDTILRQLFLKVHPKLTEAVLAHASGQSLSEEGESEEEEGGTPHAAAVRRATAGVGVLNGRKPVDRGGRRCRATAAGRSIRPLVASPGPI